jgi:hypothetical protein
MKLTVPAVAKPVRGAADKDRRLHDEQTAELLRQIDDLLAEARALATASGSS